MQGELEKNLCSAENTFIFSGVPIKKDDREILFYLRDALKYNDTAIFKDLIEIKRKIGASEEELEILEYIKRYADLILNISMQDVVKNPAGSKRVPFSEFMNQVIEAFEQKQFSVDEKWKSEFCDPSENSEKILSDAISLLKEKRNELKNGGLEERSYGMIRYYLVKAESRQKQTES